MRWFIATILLLALGLTTDAQDMKIKTEKNIVYGKGGGVNLQLDLAMPDGGKGPFPAIVCIHGGGWISGNRQQLNLLTTSLAQQDFVAVTITYRLAPQHKFPAQIEDCKAAVRWLRANAKKYRIDPDRIGAIGFSAGGHLSCLLGTADASAGLEGTGGNPTQSTRIQAVVSFFGPTDFTAKNWTEATENRFFVPFLGGTYKEKADLYRKASPIVYCTKKAPPFLFFHGTKDALVGIDQSQKMVKKLREVGASAELVTMEGDGHGWGAEKMLLTIGQSVRFFQDKLKK